MKKRRNGLEGLEITEKSGAQNTRLSAVISDACCRLSLGLAFPTMANIRHFWVASNSR
jgi:hypothetical protein